MKVLTDEEILHINEFGHRVYMESLAKLAETALGAHLEIIDMRAGWFATQAMQIKLAQLIGPAESPPLPPLFPAKGGPVQ